MWPGLWGLPSIVEGTVTSEDAFSIMLDKEQWFRSMFNLALIVLLFGTLGNKNEAV